MFFLVHTSNNDQKFDYEFDQTLQFFFTMKFPHVPLSFLCSIVVFQMGNGLGFGLWDFFLNPFIKRHCIITHVWMQLVIVTNIQPPQRDWCQKKKNTYKPCVWNGRQLDYKKRIPQNDSSKILKIKIPTNPTAYPFTLLPFLHKKSKNRKKVCTNFRCSITRWKSLLKMTRIKLMNGRKEVGHNEGTQKISFERLQNPIYIKKVPHLQGSCLHWTSLLMSLMSFFTCLET